MVNRNVVLIIWNSFMELCCGNVYLLNCILRPSRSKMSNKHARLQIFCPGCLYMTDGLALTATKIGSACRSSVQNTLYCIVYNQEKYDS